MLALEKQVEFAKKLLGVIEKEAPRDGKGQICAPFRGWANQLRMDIERGQFWIDNGASKMSIWKGTRGKGPQTAEEGPEKTGEGEREPSLAGSTATPDPTM